MNKPRMLLFDLGNVLFNVHFDRALSHWATESKYSQAELAEYFALDAAYDQLETNHLSINDYCEHLRRALQLAGSNEHIIKGWNSIFGDEVAPVTQAIARVSNILPCYALTNTNSTHQVVWQARYAEALTLFKHCFISSEIGLRKPDPAVYQYVCDQTGYEPQDILFFDDRRENTEAANALGFQTVLVTGPQSVIESLKAF